MNYLKNLGYRVPEDVAIAGYNNDPVSSVVIPPLTTVMQPSYEVGKLATKLLIDEIENEDAVFHQKVLKSELVVRGSSQHIAACVPEETL